MSSTSFTLTQAAAKRIAEIKSLQSLSNDHFLRIMVEGGGCSGFQYKMDMDDALASDDMEFTTDGERVVIDEISMEYLNGSTLEFENSLGGAFLKIKNPNATSSCGCGVSFDMKDA